MWLTSVATLDGFPVCMGRLGVEERERGECPLAAWAGSGCDLDRTGAAGALSTAQLVQNCRIWHITMAWLPTPRNVPIGGSVRVLPCAPSSLGVMPG